MGLPMLRVVLENVLLFFLPAALYVAYVMMVRKTPAFFDSAVNRLEYDLGGAYNYAATHFGGFNLYMHAATKNVHFAKQISVSTTYELRRSPPEALTGYRQ